MTIKDKSGYVLFRRDEGPTFVIRRASTLVCSQHVTAADFMQGNCRLKAGVIPSRFQWNNFYVPLQKQSTFERSSARLGVDVRAPKTVDLQSNKDSEVIVKDHDYAAHPPHGALDEALEYIAELEARLKKISLETPTMFNRLCVCSHNSLLHQVSLTGSISGLLGVCLSVCHKPYVLDKKHKGWVGKLSQHQVLHAKFSS